MPRRIRRKLFVLRQLLVALAAIACSSDFQALSTVPGAAGMDASGGVGIASGGFANTLSGRASNAGSTLCPDLNESCDAPCAPGLRRVALVRAGCTVCECTPPSECVSNDDCPAGEVCYPGQQCADDCNHPACCTGNQCSPPGCVETTVLSCELVGCERGASCSAGCGAPHCECDGTTWRCETAQGGRSAGGATNGGTGSDGIPQGGAITCRAVCSGT